MLFEQYKLAVEMADRVSARRATANGFFATVSTALVAAIGLVRPTAQSLPASSSAQAVAVEHVDKYGLIIAAAGGLALSVVWFVMLLRYRDLNRAKFEVIHDLEKGLPSAPYTEEWKKLERESPKWWRPRFAELGRIERMVPFVFAVIYIVAIVRFSLL